MKERLFLTKEMATENIIIQMVKNMKAYLKIINVMVKELIFFQMKLTILVNNFEINNIYEY